MGSISVLQCTHTEGTAKKCNILLVHSNQFIKNKTELIHFIKKKFNLSCVPIKITDEQIDPYSPFEVPKKTHGKIEENMPPESSGPAVNPMNDLDSIMSTEKDVTSEKHV